MHAQGRYRVCLLIIFSKRGIGGGLRPDSGSLLLLPRAIPSAGETWSTLVGGFAHRYQA
jgi:hypothetical protein